MGFLDKVKESGQFTLEEIREIKRQILASESYYISKMRYVYLANLSVNHAAEEAAHCIKHLCSGNEKAREPGDAFYANILHEALGFFGSKIVNHKRKCFHAKEFEKHLRYFHSIKIPKNRRLEYETSVLVTQFKKAEGRGEPLDATNLYHRDPDLFFAVTHALGYMLGDKLYYALLEGVIYKSVLRNLFYDPWRGSGKPFQIYWELIQKLKSIKIPRRM